MNLWSFGRSWKPRRVVFTKDAVAFAQVDEDTMLDAIPLAEVIGIESMVNVRESDQNEAHPQNEFEKAMDFTSAFQIRTIKKGYNAGRKYFLRASSDDERDELIKQLTVLSKIAIARAETATEWERMQSRVRVVYNSSLFQGVAAFLIIAVRTLPHAIETV